MIASADRPPVLLRLAAPIAWRDDHRIAEKLMGFAATEEGSALDMIRASEQVGEPRLRRLFYRHGLDEARHARLFRDAAAGLVGREARTRQWERLHAVRQNLHERFGLVKFVAFVWMTESRAAKQFEVLCGHFAARDDLRTLFETIARDERFHTTYSRQLLDEWIAAGREREVARAIRSVKLSMAWMAWRRAGRRIGELMAKALLVSLYVAVVPLFALWSRAADRHPTGWARMDDDTAGPKTLEDARRQF